ncbi:CBS domain-containing protein [Halobaculum marinum]|uniref:CBS domain-containing protein n=1 Tax=Halobaculum marinum TaxID=3031996 RepID=A0ABD5WU43_9EURY|nr:CBS domain-containing protein [Halobaculum sp. DT55]
MLVEQLMSREVVTCDAGGSLHAAVEQMLEATVGSVIVTRDDAPVAILTETDVLRATAVTGRPLDDIPIRRVASHPLVTTSPRTTIRNAVGTMTDNDVKKLPVVAGTDLVGIITQSDIVAHYGDFIREAHRLNAQADAWEE